MLLHPSDQQLYDAAPFQAQMFGVPLESLPPVDGELVVGETRGSASARWRSALRPGTRRGT